MNVGNSCGIAYTGLSRIGAQPTHEWIADVIAAGKLQITALSLCRSSRAVAGEAFRGIDAAIARQTFLMAGWVRVDGDLRPYLGEITNCYTAQGRLLARATDSI